MFTVTFTDEQHEDPLTKVIRMDNVLGEIPLLPGFTKSIFVDERKFSDEYKSFIVQAKEFFQQHKSETLSIVYKNDDGTYSVIDGIVKESNVGNYQLRDLAETLVKDNKTVCRSPLDRDKFHRFISEKGFLCQVGFCNRSTFANDDEETFGEKETWSFPENESVAA